jgi:hypothetical protein
MTIQIWVADTKYFVKTHESAIKRAFLHNFITNEYY